MLKRKRKKLVSLSVPVMYLLFGAFAFGCVCACGAIKVCGPAVSVETEGRSLWSAVCACVGYYGAVLLAGRFRIGVLLIPLILLIRGFVFTAAVSAISFYEEALLRAAVPTLMQLPALFYVGAASVCTAARMDGSRRFDRRQWKQNILLCAASAAAAVCAELII